VWRNFAKTHGFPQKCRNFQVGTAIALQKLFWGEQQAVAALVAAACNFSGMSFRRNRHPLPRAENLPKNNGETF